MPNPGPLPANIPTLTINTSMNTSSNTSSVMYNSPRRRDDSSSSTVRISGNNSPRITTNSNSSSSKNPPSSPRLRRFFRFRQFQAHSLDCIDEGNSEKSARSVSMAISRAVSQDSHALDKTSACIPEESLYPAEPCLVADDDDKMHETTSNHTAESHASSGKSQSNILHTASTDDEIDMAMIDGSDALDVRKPSWTSSV